MQTDTPATPDLTLFMLHKPTYYKGVECDNLETQKKIIETYLSIDPNATRFNWDEVSFMIVDANSTPVETKLIDIERPSAIYDNLTPYMQIIFLLCLQQTNAYKFFMANGEFCLIDLVNYLIYKNINSPPDDKEHGNSTPSIELCTKLRLWCQSNGIGDQNTWSNAFQFCDEISDDALSLDPRSILDRFLHDDKDGLIYSREMKYAERKRMIQEISQHPDLLEMYINPFDPKYAQILCLMVKHDEIDYETSKAMLKKIINQFDHVIDTTQKNQIIASVIKVIIKRKNKLHELTSLWTEEDILTKSLEEMCAQGAPSKINIDSISEFVGYMLSHSTIQQVKHKVRELTSLGNRTLNEVTNKAVCQAVDYLLAQNDLPAQADTNKELVFSLLTIMSELQDINGDCVLDYYSSDDFSKEKLTGILENQTFSGECKERNNILLARALTVNESSHTQDIGAAQSINVNVCTFDGSRFDLTGFSPESTIGDIINELCSAHGQIKGDFSLFVEGREDPLGESTSIQLILPESVAAKKSPEPSSTSVSPR